MEYWVTRWFGGQKHVTVPVLDQPPQTPAGDPTDKTSGQTQAETDGEQHEPQSVQQEKAIEGYTEEEIQPYSLPNNSPVE
ncbi:hypothetical protein BGX28_002740, partial [Mortierella sp. GBA30]